MKLLIQFLGQRSILFLLLVINIFGTIWGYIWYGYQLADTPARFLIFVPDSPTASMFFVFVLIAFLLRQNWPLIEALAIVTLFKYGIWAVVMNLLVLKFEGSLPWEGYMLIASHFAMAIQGILFAPYYRLKTWHLMAVAAWTLHNDVIDYLFGMMPRYGMLSDFTPQIGYFTFWLSLTAIFITYYLCIRDKHYKTSLI